jgi:nicotinamidase-related amidase
MNLQTTSQQHLTDLETWLASLEALQLQTLKPSETAVLSVDVIEGFCRVGALASPRVEAIIPNVVSLIQNAEARGIHDIAFIQDSHPENAEEFGAYPPHCVKGTLEARAASELEALANWNTYAHFEKNSISSLESTSLVAWLEERPQLKNLICVGDVTDLCLYSLAIGVKLRSLAQGLGQRVIVPENCVQTWDSPDHPGDLYHAMFLFQLKRNGVEIVKAISK